MKGLNRFLVAWVALSLLCAACQDDDAVIVPEEPVTEQEQENSDYNEPAMETVAHAAKAIELSASQKSINEGLRNFSWDLISVINESPTYDNKNVIFSPLSLEVALAMLFNATDDATLQESLSAMHLSGYNAKELNQYFSHFTTGITEADNVTRFSSSNSLWHDLRYDVQSRFKQALSDHYACEFFPVVYGPETTDKINRWVEERTYGRIDKIVGKTTHNVDFLHLLNAVYFRSPWSVSMSQLGKKPFTSFNGKVSTVEMFKGVCREYLSTPLYTATMLPFSNGAFGMFFILPNEGVTFGEVIDNIKATGQDFAKIHSSSKVVVTLPEFNAKSDVELSSVLDKLGCGNILNRGLDILSNLSGQTFGIKQIANISVDHEGAEAAAVTNIWCGSTGEPEPKPKYLTFDRPFIYGIIECSTGTPLFLGTISEL